jgi:hypothetical protein
VVKLKQEDSDTKRTLIHIKALLSDAALETMRWHQKEYGQSKRLFLSQDKEKHITTRTVEKRFSNACKKANRFILSGIVSLHIY